MNISVDFSKNRHESKYIDTQGHVRVHAGSRKSENYWVSFYDESVMFEIDVYWCPIIFCKIRAVRKPLITLQSVENFKRTHQVAHLLVSLTFTITLGGFSLPLTPISDFWNSKDRCTVRWSSLLLLSHISDRDIIALVLGCKISTPAFHLFSPNCEV